MDIPPNLSEGKIRIETTSPYKNYAGNVCSITVANRDLAILQLVKKNAFNLFCSVVIFTAGIILFILTLIQVLTKQGSDGLQYLSIYFLLISLYHLVKTKVLMIFYGNQTLYSFFVFIVLMVAPMFLEMYYCKNLKRRYQKRLKALIVASFVSVIFQLVFQVLNIADFMDMAFISHCILFITIIVVETTFFSMVKRDKSKVAILQFVALFFMGLGGMVDLVRTYMIKVGDLGIYSRYGTALFSVIMIGVHLWYMVKKHATMQETHAKILQQQVASMEIQNKQLLAAKKEAEIARAEAIDANAAKSNFLANMSHEIRTPINGVLGMDTMILKECKDKDIREFALNIQSAGRSLLSLINDILDFTDIDAGKLKIEKTAYSMLSVLQDIIAYAQYNAEKKGLQFRYDIDENIPQVLDGDSVRLTQVFNNLLSNAVKYTKEGFVEVYISWRELPEDKGILSVKISDSGIGMKKEDTAHISESFARFDNENTRNIQGVGLGLTIVTRLIHLMEGELSIESEYGKGSSFSFEI